MLGFKSEAMNNLVFDELNGEEKKKIGRSKTSLPPQPRIPRSVTPQEREFELRRAAGYYDKPAPKKEEEENNVGQIVAGMAAAGALFLFPVAMIVAIGIIGVGIFFYLFCNS